MGTGGSLIKTTCLFRCAVILHSARLVFLFNEASSNDHLVNHRIVVLSPYLALGADKTICCSSHCHPSASPPSSWRPWYIFRDYRWIGHRNCHLGLKMFYLRVSRYRTPLRVTMKSKMLYIRTDIGVRVGSTPFQKQLYWLAINKS